MPFNMSNPNYQYRLLNGFDDSRITPVIWNELLSQGPSDFVFLTWHWQKIWWDVFGRGKLLIILAEKQGKPIALAPLFADTGMIFFIGSGGSDYLDFVGDLRDPEVIEYMLLIAVEQVPDFLGFRFYHIPESSPTGSKLAEIAQKQEWKCFEEESQVSPRLNIIANPDLAIQSTRKKSLLRHEGWFSRNGELAIEHLSKSGEILPHLNLFFNQHISRWALTSFPSLFLDKKQCLFYERLSQTASETGWLRFSHISWQKKSIAFHFGFSYKGSFFWYKPSFDIAFAKNSPGEVLLRQLLLLSIEESSHTFDFGLGDEPFKKRFATNILSVSNWGLYPSSKEFEL